MPSPCPDDERESGIAWNGERIVSDEWMVQVLGTRAEVAKRDALALHQAPVPERHAKRERSTPTPAPNSAP